MCRHCCYVLPIGTWIYLGKKKKIIARKMRAWNKICTVCVNRMLWNRNFELEVSVFFIFLYLRFEMPLFGFIKCSGQNFELFERLYINNKWNSFKLFLIVLHFSTPTVYSICLSDCCFVLSYYILFCRHFSHVLYAVLSLAPRIIVMNS